MKTKLLAAAAARPAASSSPALLHTRSTGSVFVRDNNVSGGWRGTAETQRDAVAASSALPSAAVSWQTEELPEVNDNRAPSTRQHHIERLHRQQLLRTQQSPSSDTAKAQWTSRHREVSALRTVNLGGRNTTRGQLLPVVPGGPRRLMTPSSYSSTPRSRGSNCSTPRDTSQGGSASPPRSKARGNNRSGSGASAKRRARSRAAVDLQQTQRILQQHYRHHQYHPLQHKYPVMAPRLAKLHVPGASLGHNTDSGDADGDEPFEQRFRVRGQPAPVARRRSPMLWLSLKLNWGKASAAHKAALRQLARRKEHGQGQGQESTRTREPSNSHGSSGAAPLSDNGLLRRRRLHDARHEHDGCDHDEDDADMRATLDGDEEDEYTRRHTEGARLLRYHYGESQDGPTGTLQSHFAVQMGEDEDIDEEDLGGPVTTVSWVCEVCTFNNAPGTNYCQMCESDAPDQSDIDLNQVLECGLTLAQVEELQTRDISPEDYQVLLELDERVPKKTLAKEDVDAFVRATFTAADPAVDCGICLCDLEVGDDFVRLPCKHTFHDECITKWLTEYNTKCPFKCSDELKKTQ